MPYGPIDSVAMEKVSSFDQLSIEMPISTRHSGS